MLLLPLVAVAVTAEVVAGGDSATADDDDEDDCFSVTLDSAAIVLFAPVLFIWMTPGMSTADNRVFPSVRTDCDLTEHSGGSVAVIAYKNMSQAKTSLTTNSQG